MDERKISGREYNGRLLDSRLVGWQECKDFERRDKWGGYRGHETLRHYFANLTSEERDRAVELRWDESIITPRQARLLNARLLDEFDYYLVNDDITVLEANMLSAWLDDFNNLDKKPLFDMAYVLPVPDNVSEGEREDIRTFGRMNEVTSVYTPGVIAAIEAFTLAIEDLRQFVIYTYYDKEEQPLYIGCSKDFYNAHYFNSERLSFFDDVEFVGFVFMENETYIKDAKKYYIRARNPKYNKHAYKGVPVLEGLDVSADNFVVLEKEMTQRWSEWLS